MSQDFNPNGPVNPGTPTYPNSPVNPGMAQNNYNSAPVYQSAPQYNNEASYQSTPQYNNGTSYQSAPQNNNAVGSKSGLCTAALIIAIVSLFIDPLYLTTTVAAIIGIVALCQKPYPSNRNLAIAGCIVTPIAFLIQLTLDICLSVFTLGFGAISFFC